MNFQNYINDSLRQYPENAHLALFKKEIAHKMEKRAEGIRKAGLQDEKVLYDLVVELYPNLHEIYKTFVPVIRSDRSLWDLTTRRSAFSL